MAVDPKILTDEVRGAETAIRHWEQEIADRVRELAALDGFVLSTMTSLFGTKDAKVAAAAARVAEAKVRLAAARGVHADAKERLAAAEAETRAEADAEAERVMDLELRADTLRAKPDRTAAELERLEAEGDAARVALASTMEALQAAMGLLAATGTVLRGIDKPQPDDRLFADYREKAQRLQRALDATGMAWTVGGTDEVLDFSDAVINELDRLQSIEEQQERFTWIREELRGLLEGFEGERRHRAAEVERLEAERRRLLEST